MNAGGHNMQKEIKVTDYIRNMAESAFEYYYNDEEKGAPLLVMHMQALNFLKNFGLEISKNLIMAFDELKEEYDEEYYKALFLLYKNMTNENATTFIGALKGLVAHEERNEEVS